MFFIIYGKVRPINSVSDYILLIVINTRKKISSYKPELLRYGFVETEVNINQPLCILYVKLFK